MKQISLIIVLALIAVVSQSQTANLTVKITNIENVKGNMNIALFNSSEGFPSGGECFIGKVIPVKTVDFVYELKDLPLVIYAIAISQDVNDNGEQDTKWIDIP